MILSVSNVQKSFGVDEILRGVTFRIDHREKVALVGRNGTGKTTLLRILTGQYEPDSGTATLQRGAKVGYLRQEAPVTAGATVLEEAQEARKHALDLKNRLDELESKLQNASDEILEEYALLQEHFLSAEGYSAETDVRVVLQRMGFTEEEFEKQTTSLSGGEKTRLALARLLLEEPDLLILDEPTNHLDLQATEWLESWIRSYHGAVLLVSHDRAFLDNTAERVLELREGKVFGYPGPFPKYLELRAADMERQAEIAKRQAQQMAKLDEYVRRFMNSQRTAQARGRLKQLEKLQETAVQAPTAARGMKASISGVKRSGEMALETKKLDVGFDSLNLIKGLDWTVQFGERWGVIGENGSGKSTLIKVILGKLKPQSGHARVGAAVSIGYFSQDATDLDPEETPLEHLADTCNLRIPEARTLLGRFLLEGDDVFRPVKTLSGGEKNKLALARLTVQGPNLLILDEPTNHLDMDSRDALATILKEYQGTLVLISHDRHLLSAVSSNILDIRSSGPVQYPGGYSEYREWLNKRQSGAEPPKSKKEVVEEAKEVALSPREISKEIARLEKLISSLEDDIQVQEAVIAGIERSLANPEAGADFIALTQSHSKERERLDGILAAWEESMTKVDELRAMQ